MIYQVEFYARTSCTLKIKNNSLNLHRLWYPRLHLRGGGNNNIKKKTSPEWPGQGGLQSRRPSDSRRRPLITELRGKWNLDVVCCCEHKCSKFRLHWTDESLWNNIFFSFFWCALHFHFVLFEGLFLLFFPCFLMLAVSLLSFCDFPLDFHIMNAPNDNLIKIYLWIFSQPRGRKTYTVM